MTTAATILPPEIDRGWLGQLPPTLEWRGDESGGLRLLDQTALPERVAFRDCQTAAEVWDAIRRLQVRGAPAIGVAGAYGLCLGTRGMSRRDRAAFDAELQRVAAYLRGCRPTAVNLAWAINRVAGVAARVSGADPLTTWRAMLAEAHAIFAEDAETCRRIGENGAELIPDGGGVLTHCNAGALATVAYGTALAVLYAAHARGRRFRVYADETRPLLQGARLTAYELHAAGLDVTVLCDGAAAGLIRAGRVQIALVGADRIATNGDTANKVGTYGVALAARAHDVPFYVAAPRSTFDLSLVSGSGIRIEERDGDEIAEIAGRRVVADGVSCWNPAFDVTPSHLITGFVTEFGVLKPVPETRFREIFGRGG